MKSFQIDRFVEKTLSLLELERKAEVEETAGLQATLPAAELERLGLSLLRLKVAEEFTGFGGRLFVVLESTRGGALPANRLQAGDIVSLRPSRESPNSGSPRSSLPTAVVYRASRERITLALDEDPEDGLPDAVRLDKVANDVTFRRMRLALERLADYGRGPAMRLREVLFSLRDPGVEQAASFTPLDRKLDASQLEAVGFALAARDIALLHGPPGTGKTATVVELIRQAVERRERVLACAPSNLAVDNMVERLATAGVGVVRVGHPARLLPSVLDHSLDSLVAQAEGSRIAAGVRRDLEALHRRLRRASDRAERRDLRRELRSVRDEARELEERTVRQILEGADVVLATATGAAEGPLAHLEFDLVVIDEATQAVEASAWIPLLRGRRAVLAGDHRQLPPTILSREAEREGLGVTLFERLSEALGDAVTRMLTVQYRMHERIMEWSSRELYEGRVRPHSSVRTHLLADLPHVASTDETGLPVILIDTAGCDLEEEEEAKGDSRSNEGETKVVVAHVDSLLRAGVRPEEIAVITPYNAQVELLRSRLAAHGSSGLEIGSVDGFQGREKEAVVISLVRSNRRGDVGFLADDRRTNVAVTRARRHVAIVCDSATVSSHPFLGRLVEYCEQHGEYRSAWEYL